MAALGLHTAARRDTGLRKKLHGAAQELHRAAQGLHRAAHMGTQGCTRGYTGVARGLRRAAQGLRRAARVATERCTGATQGRTGGYRGLHRGYPTPPLPSQIPNKRALGSQLRGISGQMRFSIINSHTRLNRERATLRYSASRGGSNYIAKTEVYIPFK